MLFLDALSKLTVWLRSPLAKNFFYYFFRTLIRIMYIEILTCVPFSTNPLSKPTPLFNTIKYSLDRNKPQRLTSQYFQINSLRTHSCVSKSKPDQISFRENALLNFLLQQVTTLPFLLLPQSAPLPIYT